MRHPPVCDGFTLLEVIAALAITGLVLGSLFSLVAGSKRLTWRAETSLVRAAELRAVTNFALLQNQFNEVEPILLGQDYQIIADLEMEAPERKTQPTVHALQVFEVRHRDIGDPVTGSRWIQLDLPR